MRSPRRVREWTLERRMALGPGGCCCWEDIPPKERTGARRERKRMVEVVDIVIARMVGGACVEMFCRFCFCRDRGVYVSVSVVVFAG